MLPTPHLVLPESQAGPSDPSSQTGYHSRKLLRVTPPPEVSGVRTKGPHRVMSQSSREANGQLCAPPRQDSQMQGGGTDEAEEAPSSSIHPSADPSPPIAFKPNAQNVAISRGFTPKHLFSAHFSS